MKRILEKIIDNQMHNRQVVIVIGQRQVGKTFLLNTIRENQEGNFQVTHFFDFQDTQQQELFSTVSIDSLESVIGSRKTKILLLLDEIQHLPKSGAVLKLIHDHFPYCKTIATGSASYLLLKDIGDSLYGRNLTLSLFPLTFREIIGDTDNAVYSINGYSKKINKPKIAAKLDHAMIYGTLPAVFLASSDEEKEGLLKNYVSSLLFKDVFEIEGIRNPAKFKKLLTLLALQIGSEINPNELATQLNISRDTVVEYINLYEKFQILYTLTPYSQNPRKEISKNTKVYFVDLGIRNGIINNFNFPQTRTDIGALFENLVLNTIRSNIAYYDNSYILNFWRNYNGSEVDIIIGNNKNNLLVPIEVKYAKNIMPSAGFINDYSQQIDRSLNINKENLWQFV